MVNSGIRGLAGVIAVLLGCAGTASASPANMANPVPPAAANTATLAAAPPPVPQDPFAASVDPFLGAPATAHPLPPGELAPRHPFMAPNGSSNLHGDAYQSDDYPTPGPLGHDPAVASADYNEECASLTFDSHGRLLAVCVGVVHPTLRMMDPHTMATLASVDLPPRSPNSATGLFTSFGGGGYFYLDNQDRVVVPTNDGHLEVIAETGDPAQPGLAVQRSYDVSALAAGSSIISALPDWAGRLWFVTEAGAVGVVDPASGAVSGMHLPAGESIGNSFAVDETGGVFIVSDYALYRFDADPAGSPSITWRRPYDRGTRIKPGQTEHGSGTTPTIIRSGGRHFVAITDNADPYMHVLVYPADPPGGTPICDVPVFGAGRGDTDNSLIAFDNSLVVENNYGYTGPFQQPPSPDTSRETPTTDPGVSRIDVDYAHGGCHQAWTNDTVRVPTSVSKSSTANGLVYVYSHPAANEIHYVGPHPGAEDPWYLTALDIRTGRQVWSRMTGVGFGYNNNYAPITLAPDGTAYIGVLGGLVSVRDTATAGR